MAHLLLDTHALIWWIQDAPELTQRARSALLDEQNAISFSAASIYEIAFKQHRGRLPRFALSPERASLAQGFAELPVVAAHAERAAQLALIHRDPWDRVIAAQAIVEDMTVVTRDPKIATLGARTLW